MTPFEPLGTVGAHFRSGRGILQPGPTRPRAGSRPHAKTVSNSVVRASDPLCTHACEKAVRQSSHRKPFRHRTALRVIPVEPLGGFSHQLC